MRHFSKHLIGYLDKPVSSIQVDLNVVAGQDHVNLIIADVASVLRFDQPVVELPQSLVVFRNSCPNASMTEECFEKRRCPLSRKACAV